MSRRISNGNFARVISLRTHGRANAATGDRRPRPPAPAPASELTWKPQGSSSPALPSRQLPGTGHPQPAASGCRHRINPQPPGLHSKRPPRLPPPLPGERLGPSGAAPPTVVVPPPRGGLLPRGHPAAPRSGPAEPRGSAPQPGPPPPARPAPSLPSGAGCPRPGDDGSSPPPSGSRGLGGQQRGRGRGGERPPLAAGGRAVQVPSAEPEPRPGGTYRCAAAGTAAPQRRPGGPNGRSILRHPARARRLPLGADGANRRNPLPGPPPPNGK